MFFPSGPGNELFHLPVPSNGIYLESTFHTLVAAMSDKPTSDKLSGCQEQPLLEWYA